MNLKSNFIYLFFVVANLCTTTLLHANIATDGSVGIAQSLTGPNYAIPETLGTIKGDNLFHSFDKFSINNQESATFTGSDSIKNVISRVTGGEKSLINGTLRSNVGKADFYFVNPSGVVFGENAKVDVPAAFHISTTEELKFTDGSSFKASKSEQSTLTQAAPEAFGFLGIQSVNIKVNGDNIQNKGSIEINGSTLEFQPASKVSLTSSKDIAIKGIEKETNIGTETKQASLTSYGGEIELKAEGDLLLDNAAVDTSGNGGGKISLKAKNLTITNNSNIGSNNIGDKDAYAGVDVAVENRLEILNGGGISSSTLSEGSAGYVKIDAGEIKIDGIGTKDYQYTGIWSDAYSTSKGAAGNIEITTTGLFEVLNDGQISSNTSSYGDAGNITISANKLSLYDEGNDERYTGIWTDSYSDFYGNAGDIKITVSTTTEMINDSRISSDTYSQGNSGSITIKSGSLELLNAATISTSSYSEGNAGVLSIIADNIKIDGQSNSNMTGIWSISYNDDNYTNYLESNSGNINITVNNLMEILNGGQILGINSSNGYGADIKITTQNLIIDGKINNSQLTGIISDTYSKGKAGNIDIDVAGLVELLDGSQISSSTTSEGDAGDIKIKTENFTIDGKDNEQFTGIFCDTLGEGNSGILDISVKDTIRILNEAQISSSTWSEGDAGYIKINAGNIILNAYGEDKNFTGIRNDANIFSNGNAGKVEIVLKGLLAVLNGAQISSDTYSQGNAGIIFINADGLIMNNKAYIGSTALDNLSGNIGNLEINANYIKIIDKCVIGIASFSTLSEENLNNSIDKCIKINTKELILNGESTISSKSFESYPASDIYIKAENNLVISNNSHINSSANMADGGNITIQGKNIFLYDSLITTSVKGENGDGGNIQITGIKQDGQFATIADFLVMQGGFIQANAAAKNAKGGQIDIDIKGVIADKSQELTIGGQMREEFIIDKNVIQSAAPDGYSGEINISGVNLDISGSIINVPSQFSTDLELATDPCQTVGTEHASSLIQKARGGFAAIPSSPSSIYCIDKRVDELLMYEKNSEK